MYTLRKAVFISATLHAAAFLPFHTTAKPVLSDEKRMVVDYVKLPDIVKKVRETPAMNIRPKVDVSTASKTFADKDGPLGASTDQNIAKRQAQSRVEAAEVSKHADIKSTKDYIGYYQLLREKIRRNAKRGYRNCHSEGEVRMNFVLASDGRLVGCDADKFASTADEELRRIAVSSVRDASPFPAFPKALSAPTMSFTVTVVFKRE